MNGIDARPAGTQMYFRFPRLGTAMPFFAVSALWLALGLLLSLRAGSAGKALLSAAWMLGLWALCMADLLAMAKAIGGAMALMTEPPSDRKPALIVQAVVWGILKMACLGMLGYVIYSAREAPSQALLMGLSTLLIVPLIGGLWWSRKELKYA